MAKNCDICGAPLEVHRENGVPDYYTITSHEWHFWGGYKLEKMRVCRSCFQHSRFGQTGKEDAWNSRA